MSLEKPDADDTDSTGANTTRRKLMAAGAASWATVGLAGCSSNAAETTTTTTTTQTTTQEPEPQSYVVTDDMAVGSTGVPSGHNFLSACSPSRKFLPGMQAIWYVGVYHPETGEQLTDEDLGKKGVEIHFTNRDWDPVALGWAGDDEEHPAQEWGGSIVLPADASPGEVTYEVTIPKKPENTEFTPVGIAANSFTIVENTELSYVVSNYTYAINSPQESNGFVSACGPEYQFKPGMTVAFQANVYDANTGKEPGTDVINSVTLTFPNGEFEDVDLAWQGDADEHAVKAWEGSMTLPEDTAAGTYTYAIKVDAGGDSNVKDVDAKVIDQFNVIS
ncbi:MAG: hypothetical protein ABEJ55_03125 [Halanaeroarchaeum sp.]